MARGISVMTVRRWRLLSEGLLDQLRNLGAEQIRMGWDKPKTLDAIESMKSMIDSFTSFESKHFVNGNSSKPPAMPEPDPLETACMAAIHGDGIGEMDTDAG